MAEPPYPTLPAPPASPSALPSPSRRKVGLHHVVLLRSWLEGLDIREMARLYVDPEVDTAGARRIVRWVLQEFISAAQRHMHFSKARALRIDPALLSPSPVGTDIPNMEDWAADNFLSDETEWYKIERYEEYLKEARPSNEKEIARDESKARIRKRQINAIIDLENYVREYPSPADPLICWFDEGDIESFERAGIITVGDLVRTIQQEGRRWWTKVDRIGAEAAQRVAIWLKINAETIGIKPDQIDRGRSEIVAEQRATVTHSFTIRPLEYLAWPEEFVGRPRTDICTLLARNDWEAFQGWLENILNKHTRRSYQIQIERFWLWCIFEKGIPLSDAKTEHCVEYLKFLEDIATVGSSEWLKESLWKNPREYWVGSNRSVQRHTENWKPFVGRFSGRSQSQAYVIVKGFFNYLAQKHYILESPWIGVKEPLNAEPKLLKTNHALSKEQMQALIEYCTCIENTLVRTRMQLALMLAFRSGMRLFELTAAKLGHFIYVEATKTKPAYYKLAVLGKGHKLRYIPLGLDIFEFVETYLAARGIQPEADGTWNPVIPLFASIRRIEAKRSEGIESIAEADNWPSEVESTNDDIYVKTSILSRRRGRAPDVLPRTKGGVDYERIRKDFEATVLYPYQSSKWLVSLSIEIPNGISNQSFYEMLKRHCEATANAAQNVDLVDQARLKQASTHWLRHTFGTFAVNRGSKLTTIQEMMGHSSINTTAIYIKNDDADQLEVGDILMKELNDKS